MYPLCWALSEGANIITVTAEMIWFGILDLLAGPVFLFFFLYKLRGVDYAAFGLQSGKHTETETAYSHEQPANGNGNGNANGYGAPRGTNVSGGEVGAPANRHAPANGSAASAGGGPSMSMPEPRPVSTTLVTSVA